MTFNTYAKKQKPNILAVDIGNTSAHFAFLRRGVVKQERRISTAALKTKKFKRFISKLPTGRVEAVVIASVVPTSGNFLKKLFQKEYKLKTFLAGKDFQIPIVNRYKNPRQVGVDRLLNALAAYEISKRETIIIDFGTAITFDVVSKKGEYLGGVIAPGIEITLDALFQRTALLPKIKLDHPKNFIGRDTTESIRVGCSVGIGGLCDRVVEAISLKYHLKPAIIATGGYASFISSYCNRIQKISPNLIMHGIYLAYTSRA